MSEDCKIPYLDIIKQLCDELTVISKIKLELTEGREN